MGVPHITSFCCCCGLEIGAKIIGYIHFICSVVLVVTCLVYVHKFDELSETVEDAGDHLYSTWRGIAGAVAGITLVHVLLASALLYGVYKRNTIALRVWVIIMCVLFVVSIACNLALVAVFGPAGTGSDMFLNLLQAVIAYGLVGYAILCVYSYYLMVKSCEDMEGPNGTGKPY